LKFLVPATDESKKIESKKGCLTKTGDHNKNQSETKSIRCCVASRLPFALYLLLVERTDYYRFASLLA
jgi:hypothetical protein